MSTRTTGTKALIALTIAMAVMLSLAVLPAMAGEMNESAPEMVATRMTEVLPATVDKASWEIPIPRMLTMEEMEDFSWNLTFPGSDDVLFAERCYHLTWKYPKGFGIPMIDIWVKNTKDGTVYFLATEYVPIDQQEDGFCKVCLPSLPTGTYEIVLGLSYPGMFGTYYYKEMSTGIRIMNWRCVPAYFW